MKPFNLNHVPRVFVTIAAPKDADYFIRDTRPQGDPDDYYRLSQVLAIQARPLVPFAATQFFRYIPERDVRELLASRAFGLPYEWPNN